MPPLIPKFGNRGTPHGRSPTLESGEGRHTCAAPRPPGGSCGSHRHPGTHVLHVDGVHTSVFGHAPARRDAQIQLQQRVGIEQRGRVVQHARQRVPSLPIPRRFESPSAVGHGHAAWAVDVRPRPLGLEWLQSRDLPTAARLDTTSVKPPPGNRDSTIREPGPSSGRRSVIAGAAGRSQRSSAGRHGTTSVP